MNAVSQNAFLTIKSWSDSTDYLIWVRGSKSASQLWELTLRTPPFDVNSLSNQVVSVTLQYDEKGRPKTVTCKLGELRVLSATERTGVSIEGARATAISSNPMNETHLRFLKGILAGNERVEWWGEAGVRSRIIFGGIISAFLAVTSFFSFYWVRFFTLCSASTPPQFQMPCYGMVSLGAIGLAAAIITLTRTLIRGMKYRPLYVVTDHRVLVVEHEKIIVEYAPWEIYFAHLVKRRESCDVLFPTQQVGKGNLWACKDSLGLESALSKLLADRPV